MTISKKHLKQRAYKRIARPGTNDTASVTSSGKQKDTELMHPFASNLILLVMGNAPVGCGVWKYGKYLQPAKKTVQYIKQASLITNMMPTAGPRTEGEIVNTENNVHKIDFTATVQPVPIDEYLQPAMDVLKEVVERYDEQLSPTTSIGCTPRCFMFGGLKEKHPNEPYWDLVPTHPDGTLDLVAFANRRETYRSGKSNILGKMINDLKEKNPETLYQVIQYPITDVEYSMQHLPESTSITRGNEPTVLFDMDRMRNALASETIHVKPGLSREEISALIMNTYKEDGNDKVD